MSSVPNYQVSDELVEKFKKGMIIKDRKYLGKTYMNCFLGKEAVDWLVFNAGSKNRKDALKLGNDIMDRGIFKHVVGEHKLKDKDLFYDFIINTDSSSPKNLFTRIGGKPAVCAVVDDFVDRLAANKVLNANPQIKAAFGRIPVPGLKYSISEIVCQATGGPQTYTGLNMRESHAHMKITEGEWNAFAEEFSNTLTKFKVPETETKELFAIVGSLKDDIVTGDTLYARLGGVNAIAAVVSDFLDRIVKNPVLNENPSLKTANEHASMPSFKYLVTELVCMATGGPQKYNGKTMKSAHKNMGITEKDWVAFAGDFKATLDKFGVPTKEQNELFAIVGSLKADIVQPPGPKTLYDRLGGFYAVATVVDDFIDKILTDYTLNSNPVLKEVNAKASPPLFKYSVTELVCQVTGGPQRYTGVSMKDSHKNMKITDKEWHTFVALFKGSLDKFKVPVQEQQELVGIVATLKNDIVTA